MYRNLKRFAKPETLKSKLRASVLKKYVSAEDSRNLSSFYDGKDGYYYVSPSARQELRFKQTLADTSGFFRNINAAISEMKGNIILDIGSNLGYWAIAFDKYITRDKAIFAFEPDADNFLYLVLNTVKYKNIQTFRTGLSSVIEDLSVGMPDYVDGLTEDKKINTGYLSVLHNKEKQNIRFAKGDSFLNGFLGENDRVLLIKIDVEGFEDQVLLGLTQCIFNDGPAVILEINPETQVISGYSLHDVLKQFRERDYRAFIPKTRVSFSIDENGIPNQSLNMILVPHEFSDHVRIVMEYLPIEITG